MRKTGLLIMGFFFLFLTSYAPAEEPQAPSGRAFSTSEDYWSQQPAEVQALRNIDDQGQRQAEAARLAQEGYTIDNAIMVWGWDPVKTTELREGYGYTWVPAADQPNIEVAPGLSVPGMTSYNPDNPPAGSIMVGSVPNTARSPGVSQQSPAAPTFTTSDQYWDAQPAAVQALRTIDDVEQRRAEAILLANAGYTIDNAIMVWGWDPVKTTALREQYGYTWVPSGLQPNISIAPGLTMPGTQSYDPNSPPPGSIIVGTIPNTTKTTNAFSATTATASNSISAHFNLLPGTNVFLPGVVIDTTGLTPAQIATLNSQGHITLQAAQALARAGFRITVTLFGREQRSMTLEEYQNLLASGMIQPGWPFDHVGADGQPLPTFMAGFPGGATFNAAVIASASASGLNANQIAEIMNNDIQATGLAPVSVCDVVAMLQTLGLNPTPGATLLPQGSLTSGQSNTASGQQSYAGKMFWPSITAGSIQTNQVMHTSYPQTISSRTSRFCSENTGSSSQLTLPANQIPEAMNMLTGVFQNVANGFDDAKRTLGD